MVISRVVATAVLSCAFSLGHARASDVECARDFDAARGLIERNYSGYADKRSRIGEQALDAALSRARAKASAAASPQDCRAALLEVTGPFRDHHLKLREKSDGSALDSPAAGSSQAEELSPSLELLSDSTALLRIPSFDLTSGKSLKALVQSRRADIVSREVLIVDVRGNGGGTSEMLKPITEFIDSGPVVVPGFDVLATAENTRGFEQELLPRLACVLSPVPVDSGDAENPCCS